MLLPAERATLCPALTALAIATMLLGPLSAHRRNQSAPRHRLPADRWRRRGHQSGVVANRRRRARRRSSMSSTSMLTIAALYLVAGAHRAARPGHRHPRDGRPLRRELAASRSCSSLCSSPSPACRRSSASGRNCCCCKASSPTAIGCSVFSLLLSSLLTLIAGARLWSHIFWRSAQRADRTGPTGRGASLLLTGASYCSAWRRAC